MNGDVVCGTYPAVKYSICLAGGVGRWGWVGLALRHLGNVFILGRQQHLCVLHAAHLLTVVDAGSSRPSSRLIQLQVFVARPHHSNEVRLDGESGDKDDEGEESEVIVVQSQQLVPQWQVILGCNPAPDGGQV